ncbi:LOW QUALITY PROTEIN: melanoma-associated antigen B10-like [Erethizon dorsatum]
MPCREPSTATSATDASYRSNINVNNQVKERPRYLQAPLATGHFPRSLLDEKVIILVQYLPNKYQVKDPITKTEMLRNLIQLHRNYFCGNLKKASENLELNFGLHMKEMDPNRHVYVLVNKLELSCDAGLSNDKNVPMTGLLMTIQGMILTKGNCAPEKQVWQIMNAIGLYSGREHFLFGEPKKVITKNLLKEKYLESREVPNSDPQLYEFLWALRAHIETSIMKVLDVLAKVRGSIPRAFPSWNEEALKDEEERAQSSIAAKDGVRDSVNECSKGMGSCHP